MEEHIYQKVLLASAFPLARHGGDQLTSSDHGQGERRKTSWIGKAHGCDESKSIHRIKQKQIRTPQGTLGDEILAAASVLMFGRGGQ